MYGLGAMEGCGVLLKCEDPLGADEVSALFGCFGYPVVMGAVRDGMPMIAVISNRPGEGSSGGDHANVFLIRADGQQIR